MQQEQQPKGLFARIVHAIQGGMIVEELEADLYLKGGDVNTSRKMGELEYTRHKNGNAELEIDISYRMKFEDGEELTVLVHGIEVCRIPARTRDTEVTLRTKQGHEIPPIHPGDPAQIMHLGQVILEGVFRIDD